MGFTGTIPAVNNPRLASIAPNTSWQAPVWGQGGPSVVFHAGTISPEIAARTLLNPANYPVGSLSGRQVYEAKARLKETFRKPGRHSTEVYRVGVPFTQIARAIELNPVLTGSICKTYEEDYIKRMGPLTPKDSDLGLQDLRTADARREFQRNISIARYSLNQRGLRKEEGEKRVDLAIPTCTLRGSE